MLLLCKAHDKSCFILWQEEWCGIHHIRQQQDSKHTACCSIVVSIRYCRGVTQLLALPPMQHTLFVIVTYSKLSWGFNGSSLPIADSSNTELKIWRKPHHAHDADHRERPAVGSMQVKLSRLQKRKPDESLGWCDFPNEWWSSCSTRFSLSGNGLCMCVYLCVSACVLWLLGYDLLSFWEKTIHFSLLYKGTWFNIVVINCLSSLISCSRESRA